MMQVCGLILLFRLFATLAECLIVKEAGENVTLTCSSNRCPKGSGGYSGMYLYHRLIEEREVFYFKNGSQRGISERVRYMERIQSNQHFMDHNFTISGLTVDDSGIYTCVYKQGPKSGHRCNMYTVFVRGLPPCVSTTAERSPVLLIVIIVAACAISVLLSIITILLIIPKVKTWNVNRRILRRAAQESTEYEVMTKYSFRPAAAPEQPTPSLHD